MKRRGRRWVWCAAVLAVTLVGAEVALQGYYRLATGAWLFRRAALPIYVTDPDRGWSVRPNLSYEHRTNEFSVTLYTNSRGFRVSQRREEYAQGPDPSKFRVMLLGPSFAFGWAAEFEDSFASRLAGLLAGSPITGGRPVELINAGVPGIPPEQNLHWFERVGCRYRPDLVVQLNHRPLTVRANPRFEYAVTAGGYLVPKHPGWFGRVKEVAKVSALGFYTWTAYARLGAGSGGDLAGNGRTMRGPAPFDQGDGSPFDPGLPRVARATAFYRELEAAVSGCGGRLVVVMFPPSYCIHREDVGRWRLTSGFWDPAGQVAFTRRYTAYLNEQGIRCVNIFPDLAEAARRTGERLYYWLDTHWTPLGNRVAAKAVADYLLTQDPTRGTPDHGP